MQRSWAAHKNLYIHFIAGRLQSSIYAPHPYTLCHIVHNQAIWKKTLVVHLRAMSYRFLRRRASELYPYSIRAYQRDICRNERQWVINQVGLDGCICSKYARVKGGILHAYRMDGQRKDNDDASEMCTRYVYLLIYMRLYTIYMYTLYMCWLKMGNKICCCWHGTGLKGADGIAHRRGRNAD